MPAQVLPDLARTVPNLTRGASCKCGEVKDYNNQQCDWGIIMFTFENRQKAHNEINHIFKKLLPVQGMAERPEQADLSHRMLDSMLDSSIALCDAGTGIGKTLAYLVAGTVFQQLRAISGLAFQPILVSTSSIALQNAVQREYLPFLSAVLMADGMIDQPIRSVIRKGKSHYVCDERLEHRLEQVDLQKKNKAAAEALLSLREWLDTDEAVHLSGYDRDRICVPQVCDCQRDTCRYRAFLDACNIGHFSFQICNHNLLLADTIHRNMNRGPILPDSCAIIIDEAHKLPETARQMLGTTLEAGDIQSLIRSLRREKYLLAAESLTEMSAPLLRKMALPFDKSIPFEYFSPLLIGPERTMTVIGRQLYGLLTPPTQKALAKVFASTAMFNGSWPDMVFYTAEDKRGGTMLCATVSDLAPKLRHSLWSQSKPVILTSGTLAAGGSFHRFREEAGLSDNGRVRESVSRSPFNYWENCLLYMPEFPPRHVEQQYQDNLADEIVSLLEAAWGHALLLFTSYAAMSAVKERLAQKGLFWPLLTLGRNAAHTMELFKAQPGSVLLASGAAWEGLDFPGDCVSLLVIPRLPFAHPDALKEKEKKRYPSLRAFIQAVMVPEMQIKLKQGFGRAIRTETDTCVVAILDERAVHGKRYHKNVIAALPEMRLTSSCQEVEDFIRKVKAEGYFQEGCT